MRLLVIEDDEVIADSLGQALTKDGYSVDVARDGETGLKYANAHQYGLILLDLMLPGRDGFSVCEALRMKKNRVPILMLTARDQLDDKVRGLDSGADDYLPKPFAYPELAARIRALLRRESSQRTSHLHVADLEIDVAHKSVTRNGEHIHLTPREYTLLEALARNRGRTLTREMIVDSIWADDESLSNTVNFHVTSLRKKIDVGREKSLIETMHGFGYRIPEETG